MMKILIFVCMLVILLQPSSAQSVEKISDSLSEREDELDVTKLTDEQISQLLELAQSGLKRAADELLDKGAELLNKRQKLPKFNFTPGNKPPLPKFSFKPGNKPPLPKFNFKLPPPPPKLNLGKGFSLGAGGLSYQKGNFRVNLTPIFSGLKPTGGRLTVQFRF